MIEGSTLINAEISPRIWQGCGLNINLIVTPDHETRLSIKNQTLTEQSGLLPHTSPTILVRLSDAVQEHSSESSHPTLLYTKDSSERIPGVVAWEILEAVKVAENNRIEISNHRIIPTHHRFPV
jgi:hypothetical protein